MKTTTYLTEFQANDGTWVPLLQTYTVPEETVRFAFEEQSKAPGHWRLVKRTVESVESEEVLREVRGEDVAQG